jgi:regulator of protease activity HflC (stomatin/prohibitin superfamily)
MNQGDYLTYRKAATTAIIGLVIQLILTLTVFFYARSATDATGGIAAIFLLSGVLVWGVLLLVFDQHRRERIETMEAEQLAVSGAAAASAFENTGDEMRVAARRLAFMYKWIVPGTAILLALINIWFGFATYRNIEPGQINTTDHAGWALAIGIAVAVVGFVFARFISGMAKVDAWANLRAGATTSVAAALVGVILGVGGFLDLALGIDFVINYGPHIVSIGMMAYGAEIILNLLLDIYRPRKPGELPRPAFDSRFLSLLAAPDRIAENVGEAVNYQFGIDVTSSWFYQLLSRWILAFIAIAVGIGWLMSSLVVVEPHERGLILTNGVISEPLFSIGGEQGDGDVGPGLHVKWPWPFSTYETPVSVGTGDEEVRTTTGVRVLHLASNPPSEDNKPILWTENHTRSERLNIVQPERNQDTESRANGDGGASTVAELSLVAAEVPMHYVVRNVKLFDQFAAPGQREQVLRQVGRRVVTQYMGELAIDEILSTHRTTMPSELKNRLEQAYAQFNNGAGAGIEILFIGINGVHPPTRVAPSFERVISARQNRESLVEEALKAQISELADVAGSVELAEEISEKLRELDALRRSAGSDSDEYIEAELEVQRILERAGGEAGELILSASAKRWVRHMSERGLASLLQGQQEAYLAAPELYRSKMYFEALLEAMADARVYLTPAELESLKVRLELQDKQAGTTVFDAERGAASQ